MFQAQTVTATFDPNKVQLSTLLSIKTGGCSEDCGSTVRSRRATTPASRTQGLLDLDDVLTAAKAPRPPAPRASAWARHGAAPSSATSNRCSTWCARCKALGLETCATLGMLKDGQAEQLKEAGLDYYNHNLDTAPEFYGDIITTREYQDRLDTLEARAPGRPARVLRRHRRHGRIADPARRA